nr:uncharacterized protein LOC115253591 [Aedes albopictus]
MHKQGRCNRSKERLRRLVNASTSFRDIISPVYNSSIKKKKNNYRVVFRAGAVFFLCTVVSSVVSGANNTRNEVVQSCCGYRGLSPLPTRPRKAKDRLQGISWKRHFSLDGKFCRLNERCSFLVQEVCCSQYYHCGTTMKGIGGGIAACSRSAFDGFKRISTARRPNGSG